MTNETDERQTSKKYKGLLEKRTLTIQSIQFHAKKVGQIGTNPNKLEAMSRIPLLESSFQKFEQINNEIEESSDFKATDFQPPSEEVTETYISAMAKLKEVTKDSSENLLLNSTMSNKAHSSHEIKLPPITISTFSGDYLEWTPFFDSFTSTIDRDPDMSQVSKFHYLKTFLKGSALSTINRLPVTDSNYKLAWKLLKDRFHNRRAIVNSCLNAFINQKIIQKAKYDSVRSLIDTTKEAIQCIEQLDVSVDSWGPFIVFTIESKLDDELKKEWENHLGGGTRIPLYQDMINFLEMRCRILENSP